MWTIKRHILKESFQEISHDTKLIRLATITTFIHSLIFVLYISYRASNVLATYQWGDNALVETLISYIHIGNSSVDITLIIIIGILLLIWFSILPPIGEGAMIFYLDNPKKQGSVSLGKWLNTFLQMFELDAALYAFNVLTFLIALFRVYVMWILDNGFIITLMTIWWFVIIIVAFLLPYSKLFITLEKQKFFDAMKLSMNLSIENFALTIKFIVVDIILHLRFLINIIIVFGIPLGLMYLWSKLGITHNSFVRGIFVVLVVGLFLLTAYINGIIEAFFATYRYKVYKHIKIGKKKDQMEQEERERIKKPDEDVIVAQQPNQAWWPQNVTINQYVMPPWQPQQWVYQQQVGQQMGHMYPYQMGYIPTAASTPYTALPPQEGQIPPQQWVQEGSQQQAGQYIPSQHQGQQVPPQQVQYMPPWGYQQWYYNEQGQWIQTAPPPWQPYTTPQAPYPHQGQQQAPQQQVHPWAYQQAPQTGQYAPPQPAEQVPQQTKKIPTKEQGEDISEKE